MCSIADHGVVRPCWPAPQNVFACTTTRSIGRFDGASVGFNLAFHASERGEITEANRRLLKQLLHLPAEPMWLKQVHGNQVVEVRRNFSEGVVGDACVCFSSGQVCAVLTADCAPVVLCNKSGTSVALVHAGWRGLAAGILELTVQALKAAPGELMAWTGPAIGPHAYEVGDNVRSIFVDREEGDALAFLPGNDGTWFANLPLLVRNRLMRVGVVDIFGGDHCTYTDAKRFFSHRRERSCGRMATLAWFT